MTDKMPAEIWADQYDHHDPPGKRGKGCWFDYPTDPKKHAVTTERYIRADICHGSGVDEIARLRRMNGRNSEVITELETECVSLRNELARLRRIIEEAPHDPDCQSLRRGLSQGGWPPDPCDCWKSRIDECD